ncbi:gamma-glutamyl-gamma-aminobutyrate hydrolase family protein [Streptosporangiaceae bacterium NEAU-GS5]|nr:gamma-glutamyl-gamma-aminobutyrate hydrolase family protein [Streptosporangiaceae bacterium NEAU-GS5]
MRPVIGITCYVEDARFNAWNLPAALLPFTYVDLVARAGGQPVILPPAGEPEEVVGRLDGLVIAGGGDIDPARYGAAPHPATGFIRKFRDESEFALTQAALDAGLPILGICRGMEVLNVVLGGTLHQHLPDLIGHTDHAPAPATYGRVAVRLGPELADLYGVSEIVPAHYHHQAIDRLGAGLTVAATAPDGTVEAVKLRERVHAVQWHPEADDSDVLFRHLITG